LSACAHGGAPLASHTIDDGTSGAASASAAALAAESPETSDPLRRLIGLGDALPHAIESLGKPVAPQDHH
jgi:hypothetical protein